MKPHGIVYRVIAPDDSVYIGATTTTLATRKRRHKHDALTAQKTHPFARALREIGVDNFHWEVLAECDTQDELDSLEVAFIAAARAEGLRLYNEQSGGSAGYTQSAQSRLIMSERRKGGGKGRVPWNKGKTLPPLSPEHRAAISAGRQARLERDADYDKDDGRRTLTPPLV